MEIELERSEVEHIIREWVQRTLPALRVERVSGGSYSITRIVLEPITTAADEPAVIEAAPLVQPPVRETAF